MGLVDGWQAVAGASEMEEGRPLVCEVAGRLIAVILLNGVHRAVDAQCPHKFGDLAAGGWSNGAVTCPVHAATFDVVSGAPKPGSVTSAFLPVHDVRISDGNVEVRLNG